MNRNRAKELLPIIQAYADGKTIQYRTSPLDEWCDFTETFGNFRTDIEYRIKPVDFSVSNCVRTENDSDVIECDTCKHKNKKDDETPCNDCFDRSEWVKARPSCANAKETFRPFSTVSEFIDKYKVKNNMVNNEDVVPLIWVRDKECHSVNLITAYYENCVFIQDVFFDLSELFDKYEFLDGTPCGVEEVEV